eukprot:TRINITY_DN22540_c0_g2_i3.p1 TRINITY_DN22540_c0_g2~~TRINITY_DN22540_c0_g2_i3.p1  ORF type:complete len:109 (-),score=1.63 TRINITY_DN22540_c0_g2_i3:506-832(-)
MCSYERRIRHDVRHHPRLAHLLQHTTTSRSLSVLHVGLQPDVVEEHIGRELIAYHLVEQPLNALVVPSGCMGRAQGRVANPIWREPVAAHRPEAALGTFKVPGSDVRL